MAASPDPSAPLTWVIGAGGLLGQHTVRAAAVRGPVYAGPPVPWQTAAAAATLRSAAAAFGQTVADRPWQVVWAAGSGVTASSPEVFAAEYEAFDALLTALADGAGPAQRGLGAVFLSSSAGGVYAGAGAPPFDESTPPQALAPYGEAKLRLEQRLAAWSASTGVAALTGRIANLYGPGQNLAKPQGLISQLCWHDLVGRPLSIYVPIDTIRDYLYAPDAADLLLDSLDALRADTGPVAGPGRARVKVLASGRPVSIAQVIGTLRTITRRRPNLILASRPQARYQALNLALRSVVYPEVDQRPLTPLLVGMASTRADLAARIRQGGGRIA